MSELMALREEQTRNVARWCWGVNSGGEDKSHSLTCALHGFIEETLTKINALAMSAATFEKSMAV